MTGQLSLDIGDTDTRFPQLDDSLPHQIRFIQSPYSGGLGVAVSCTCQKRLHRKLVPLVKRSTLSNEDSWEIYNSHLDESA